MATGKSITDAIRISRRTAPPLIADEISLLVARLNNRWETRDALMRFADAIDSPDADGVVAALILASSRGANGASVTLQALADSIQAQLKGRRAVEVERSKPYVVVRQVTIISLSTLVLVFAASPDVLCAVPDTSGSGAAIGAVDQLRWLAALDAAQGATARRARAYSSDNTDDHQPGAALRHAARRRAELPGGRLRAIHSAAGGCRWSGSAPTARHRQPSSDVGPVSSRSERLGALLYRVVPIPLSHGQRRALRLQDKSIAEFYADKAVMAIVGALLPGLAGAAFAYLTGHLSVIPAVAVASWWSDRLLRA